MKIRANVLKIKQEDGTWISVPAISGGGGDLTNYLEKNGYEGTAIDLSNSILANTELIQDSISSIQSELNTKIEETDLVDLIKNVTYNSNTGVLSFTQNDNTNIEVNLPLESVISSGAYNDTTKNLELTLNNGNVIYVPVGDLVDTYTADEVSLNLTNGTFAINQDILDDINGKLTQEQADLRYAKVSDLATVATSNDYNDLDNLPDYLLKGDNLPTEYDTAKKIYDLANVAYNGGSRFEKFEFLEQITTPTQYARVRMPKSAQGVLTIKLKSGQNYISINDFIEFKFFALSVYRFELLNVMFKTKSRHYGYELHATEESDTEYIVDVGLSEDVVFQHVQIEATLEGIDFNTKPLIELVNDKKVFSKNIFPQIPTLGKSVSGWVSGEYEKEIGKVYLSNDGIPFERNTTPYIPTAEEPFLTELIGGYWKELSINANSETVLTQTEANLLTQAELDAIPSLAVTED